VIPVASSLASAMTFFANCLAVAVFLAVGGIRPRAEWLLLGPLLLEFYVFVLGLALLASTLFVRFRDVGQTWAAPGWLRFFASPVMSREPLLPGWAERLTGPNPFVQVMQATRAILLGPDAASAGVAAPLEGRLLPIAIAVAVLAAGLAVHRREAPRF